MAVPGPSRVQSVIKNVLTMHEQNDTVQINGILRFFEGHNIANCASRRA